MSPMPPSDDGALQITRIALTRLPNSTVRASSCVWIAAEWPRPSNSTIFSASVMPSSVEDARSTARTGHSFSRVSGSCGPTPDTSARITDVSAGTVKPACSAIHTGDLPTTAGLSLAPAQFSPSASTPKTKRSSFAFSAGVVR